jgi:pimeloyl-ACP methyl ester carboxylesterase
MTLAFEEFGSGKPLVLLHAFPLSGKMWLPQIASIVENNFHVIVPDLPGFGKSKTFSNEINRMEAMAKAISELLIGLNIPKAIIGGLSMGGYVALNLFRLFPENFAGIILCDTTHSADTREKQLARFELIEKIEKMGMIAIVENVLPNLLGDYTKENNRQLITELNSEILQTNEKATIAALRGMAERKDHESILGKIKIPTLLIFGDEDKITDINNAQSMNASIPNSELKIIKNCGHLSNLEKPKEFNQILVEFIKEIKF